MANPAIASGANSDQVLAQAHAEIERLRAMLAAQSHAKLTPKVSEKGALSVYGLGRFPVTLYREQWERLFAGKALIEGFIQAHIHELKTKEAGA